MDEKLIARDIIGAVTEFIFAADKPAVSDAIFLPGDSNPEAPEEAARLYALGLAPALIPSGGFGIRTRQFLPIKNKREIYNGNYTSECEFYSDVLLKNGVPESAIIREGRACYTKENAFLSREEADKAGLTVGRGMIVCKSFHARRCLMYYRLAFPEAELLVVPVDVYGIARDNWYKTEYGVERVFGEISRCGDQFPGELRRIMEI